MELSLKLENGIEYLENMVLVKIAVNLWTNCYFQYPIDEYNFDNWRKSELKVQTNLRKLLLPKILAIKLQMFVQIIGREIFSFKNYLRRLLMNHHCPECSTGILTMISLKLQWTARGVINRTKTFQLLFEDECISYKNRFLISAYFGFLNYSSVFWDKMAQEEKDQQFHTIDSKSSYPDILTVTVLSITDEDRLDNLLHEFELETMLDFLLRNSIHNFNLNALEYCFSSLPTESRKDKLIEAFFEVLEMYAEMDDEEEDEDENYPYVGKHDHANEMLLFLSKQLDGDMLNTLASMEFKFSYILSCLLEWPYQEQFLKTFHSVKNFISKKEFSLLILNIVHKIKLPFLDFDYSSLLSEIYEFTLQSRIEIEEFNMIECMMVLIAHENEKCFPLIRNYMILSEREKLINLNECIVNCLRLASNSKWEFLKKLIDICLPGRLQVENFQMNCIKFEINNPNLHVVSNRTFLEEFEFFQFTNKFVFRERKDLNVLDNMET